MADYSQWVNELARRTGASVEQSDIDRLNQTNPDDAARLQGALEAQYRRRAGSGQTGSGMEAAAATAAGYGSARSEKADDQYNPSAGGAGGAGSVAQQWGGKGGGMRESPGGVGGNMFPDWYKDIMTRQLSMQEEAQRKNTERGNALYGILSDRAKQSLEIDRNDPIIRAQSGAFSAKQRRAQRNYISDVAESAGPYANIQGERRMAAERYGQATGGFEAELMGRELSARRAEIQQALSGMSGILSADQQRELAMQLKSIDAAMSEAGLGVQRGLGLEGLGVQRRGQDIGYDVNLRQLGLQDWDRQMYYDLLQRGVV